MRVVLDSGESIDLGQTQTAPTIGIIDYSKRVTDDFGVTTVVPRSFSRRMSVRVGVPFDSVDTLQQRLAALRSTPATWIADEQIASLAVRGFYKDFEVDLAVQPLSSCSLTIEGLAEAALPADPGGDPAPIGQASTLRLLQPVVVTTAMLAASSVPEADAPEWAAGTRYAKGARVMKAATHRVYESLVDANTGADPSAASDKWLDVGPTNRWAMLDQALGTSTTAADTITVALDAGMVNAVALLDVVGSTVRVQAPGYDRTQAVGTGAGTFLNLPLSNGRVTVTISGKGPVSVGTLLVGKLLALGITEASPTAAITDYSRKSIDEFGAVTIVPRAFAKRMTARALLRTDAVDLVANRLTAARARPALWIGADGLDSLTVYGFFKEFEIVPDGTTAKLSLSIEGLSSTTKLDPLKVAVEWSEIGNRDGLKPEDKATYGSTLGVSGTLGNVKRYTGGFWFESDLYTTIGIASGFAGQGALATLSQLAYGSTYLSGFGALAPLSSLMFGTPQLLESDGVSATLAAFKTIQGIASGYAGQGPFSTISTVAFGSALLTGFGNLAGQGNVMFGDQFLLEAPGTRATLPNFKTSQGIASGYAGQGPFSTISSVAFGSSLLTGFGNLAGQGNVMFGDEFLLEAPGTRATLPAFKTSQGIASGYAGQGPFSTISSVAFGSSLLTGFGNLAGQGNVVFGDEFLLESAGTRATLPNFKTSQGIASGFMGQGKFATAGAIGRDALFQGFFSANAFSLGYSITRSDGTTTVTESMALTQLGISAGFAGQGKLSLQDVVTADQVVSGRLKNVQGNIYWDLADAKGRRQITPAGSGRRFVDGAGIGNGDLLLWYGPTSVPEGSETADNCYFALSLSRGIVQNVIPNGLGASAGARQTIAFGQSISKVIEPGQTLSFDAQLVIGQGGTAGNYKLRIIGGPYGQSPNALYEGQGSYVSSSEPGFDTASGSYTNNTGRRQQFTFYTDVQRIPASAGGGIDNAQSFLSI